MMTHDELLAKIVKLSITPETNVVPSELATALMAVVELHKPSENYAGNVCWHCFNLAYEPTGLSMEYEDFTYPCPTIQAIEKELN